MFDLSKITATPNTGSHHSYCPTIVAVPTGTGYPSSIYVYRYPTSNCQVWCIAIACSLFKGNISLEDTRLVIAYIGKMWGSSSKQLLIDVNQDYLPQIQKVFKAEQFVFINKYNSTNNSKMVMCLIKVDYNVLNK